MFWQVVFISPCTLISPTFSWDCPFNWMIQNISLKTCYWQNVWQNFVRIPHGTQHYEQTFSWNFLKQKTKGIKDFPALSVDQKLDLLYSKWFPNNHFSAHFTYILYCTVLWLVGTFRPTVRYFFNQRIYSIVCPTGLILKSKSVE
jgi:hypothetical protein